MCGGHWNSLSVQPQREDDFGNLYHVAVSVMSLDPNTQLLRLPGNQIFMVQTVAELQQFCKDEWFKIPPQSLKRLIASYCKRLIAVVVAKGGPTSY